MTAVSGLKMRRWTAAAWVTMTVTAVFFLAAYAAPGWVFTHEWHWFRHSSYGLWQRCDRWSDLSTCSNIVNKLTGDPDWLNATRALMSLTGIGLIISIIVFAVTFCLDTTARRMLLAIQALLLLISSILALAGVIVYGTRHEYTYSHFGYSFYFGIAVVVGCLLSGIWTVLDACENHY